MDHPQSISVRSTGIGITHRIGRPTKQIVLTLWHADLLRFSIKMGRGLNLWQGLISRSGNSQAIYRADW